MATRTELSLVDARITAVEQDGTRIRLRLEPFFVYVSLTGSEQQTKWRQEGSLVFEDAELTGGDLQPGTLSGGDLHDNAYTYRDRVPLPLDSRGRVGCTLRFRDAAQALEIRSGRVRLETVGQRRYVQHVG